MTIQLKSKAKVNLSLHVTGRRENGYHTLESLTMFADDIFDMIEINPSTEKQGIRLECHGSFGKRLENMPSAENSIIKAFAFFKDKTGYEFHGHVVLHKELPVASGIGGGSSNAACVLKWLMEYYAIPSQQREDIIQSSAALGADLPVCLYGHTCWVSGIGDHIEPVRLEFQDNIYALLVNAGAPVSTVQVFQARHGDFTKSLQSKPLSFSSKEFLYSYLQDLHNDLTSAAILTEPDIKNVLYTLERAEQRNSLVRMSGSGGTCFALYQTQQAMMSDAEAIKAQNPEWWIQPTIFL